MKRFQYTPPWDLYQPYKFRVGRSSDEWLNKCWAVRVPFLGEFAVFLGTVDRSGWYAVAIFNNTATFVSPDGRYYADVHLKDVTRTCDCEDGCLMPMPMTLEEILRHGDIVAAE